uniref:Aminophospholipid ATPase n=1 Tax=Arundo donax TaxID=35708 RepID=A0A0A9F7P6_ARUDO
MPAAERVSMQAGTPSCSLSSIAVHPINIRSFSINSATSSSFLSRSRKDDFA